MLPHRKLTVSGLTNKETLLNAEKAKCIQKLSAVAQQRVRLFAFCTDNIYRAN